MKGRESGMPDETYWESFFDPYGFVEAILGGIDLVDVVEFGSGYGTFTLPVARLASGVVHALDIDVDSISAFSPRFDPMFPWCGIHRNQPYFEGAEKSTMKALADWVVESERVLTF